MHRECGGAPCRNTQQQQEAWTLGLVHSDRDEASSISAPRRALAKAR